MFLSDQLIFWYQIHQRNLPWRHTNDPYFIWLSEIILQQTRVEQGRGYYDAFVQKYPSISALANAKEEDVLRLWQGLGYYSRARNLLHAAKTIESKFGGVFPKEYKQILDLKGIGPYTAAAIASFAYNLPHAVVDGNVYRFLARYFGIETPINTTKGQKEFQLLAQKILNPEKAAIHNQAIMEFGALQCKPQNPNCIDCPLKESCLAFAQKKVAILPKKQGKIKVSNRYFNYFVVSNTNNEFLLKKRTEKDVWFQLYDFPLLETDRALSEIELTENQIISKFFQTNDFIVHKMYPEKIHLLSHQRLHLRFIHLIINNYTPKNEFRFFSTKEIQSLPLPRPIEQFFKQL